ncbi:MAG: cytochrome b/b6 domain-containing protein, partial [Proteobacteria bacterium]|nr:cytochrome b/b6 domain-containing protein [Pseudomonadota bacterium]
LARRWHLTFALVLGFGLAAFMIASLINRHFKRDLRVPANEVTPRHLAADALAHVRFDFHNPDDPAAYNTLQKLSYVATIFLLIPLMILTGLAMSPAMDAAWPWLLDIFGGRQSARSIHFIAAALIVAFIVVHLSLVILAGPVNEVMSMITGWSRLPEESES